MSFVALLTWSQVFPGAFAGLLSTDQSDVVKAINRAKEVWNVALCAESLVNLQPGLADLRNRVFWLSWPV